MSIGEMQSVYTRLYVDGSFLERFCADPVPVLAGYSLSDRERDALIDTDRDAIREFAASLRVKTFGRFKHPYRLMHALEPKAVYQVFLRFYELRRIGANERFYNITLEFGEFLEQTLLDLPHTVPYGSELTRFERSIYAARFTPRPHDFQGFDRNAPIPEITVDSKPLLRNSVHLGTFEYNVADIEKQIDAGETPENVEPSLTHVVFQSFEQRGRAKKFQITRPFYGVLSRADGERTVAEIATEVARDMNADDVLSPVLNATRKTAEMGLVETAP